MKKVLLVDDDIFEKELFEEAVSKIEIKVKVIYVQDSEYALRLLADPGFTKPDYIFIDYNMPKLNGLELIGQLRSRQVFTDVPIFIYTTAQNGAEIESCKLLGAVHIQKPLSISGLCRKLNELIN